MIDDFEEEIRELKEKGIAVEEEFAAAMFLKSPFKMACVPPSEGQGIGLNSLTQ
jgi:hypothetical protein